MTRLVCVGGLICPPMRTAPDAAGQSLLAIPNGGGGFPGGGGGGGGAALCVDVVSAPGRKLNATLKLTGPLAGASYCHCDSAAAADLTSASPADCSAAGLEGAPGATLTNGLFVRRISAITPDRSSVTRRTTLADASRARASAG